MRSDTRSEPCVESRGSALWAGRASCGSVMLREGQVGFPLPRRDLLIEILAALRAGAVQIYAHVLDEASFITGYKSIASQRCWRCTSGGFGSHNCPFVLKSCTKV